MVDVNLTDTIFGNLSDPDQRIINHLESIRGVKHLFKRLPLDPVPNQPVTLILTTDGIRTYDSACCFFTLDGSDPAADTAQRIELKPVSSEWDLLAWEYIQTWQVEIPPQSVRTLLRYHLAAHRMADGQWIFADNQAEKRETATDFALSIDADSVPEWTKAALTYHIFLDRFYPGEGKPWNKVKSLSDFYGGTIRGVIEKLDYIQQFGFNTLWLSPFFKSTTHHGYNASDYYTVEPRLGTNADIKELIEKAHARGIRVILDFVANHWSKDQPSFQDALKHENSPYHDWYFWNKWPNDYECYFQVKELPQLNLKPGPARDYLLEVARYWLKEGFDGYRLDFAYGPPHDFWVDFRCACRQVKPDCWIFGEVIHTVEMQRSYMGIMDGTLDFFLTQALRETFAFEHISLEEFDAFLRGHESFFPRNFSRPSFLDNHDMSRFIYIASDRPEKVKLAALVQYTLSGPPIVYNGLEAGVTQERPMRQGVHNIFEEARQPMKWNHQANAELINYFIRLGKIRVAHPVLWDGSRRVIHLDNHQKTYAYLRENSGERVFTIVNLSSQPQNVKLPRELLDDSFYDELNGIAIFSKGDHWEITLPAYSEAFLSSAK